MAHLPPTTRPQGGLKSKPWTSPHTPRRRVAGCRRRLRLNPRTPTTEHLVASNQKGRPLRGCFASLDRFPAPSASDRFATPKEMERGHGDAVVHFTLDALNRPNTQPRGMWIGFATCPCGLASESGVWAKPQGLLQIRPNNVI